MKFILLRVQSLLGSVLDIASDRAVEQVMWFVLADPRAAAPDSAVRHALVRGDGMRLEGIRFIRVSERTPSLPSYSNILSDIRPLKILEGSFFFMGCFSSLRRVLE